MNSAEKILNYYNNREYANLTQKAYDILLEMALTLLLEPDHIYSESELSDLIGIGKTPVREAVQKLQTNMLVEIIPRSGIRISPLNLADYYLQIEVRRLLEKLIIVRASKFATKEEKATLKQFALDFDKANKNNDDVEALRIDTQMHEFIANCARNPFAKKALEPFQILEQRLYYIQYNVEPNVVDKINNLHVKLMNEISKGDGDKACEYFDEMLNCTELLVKKRMEAWTQFKI